MQPIFDYRTLLFSPPQQARIAQNTLCKHFTKASLNSISRSSVSLSHCKKAVFFKPLEQKQMERMMKGRQRAKTYSIHTEQDLLATHLQNRVQTNQFQNPLSLIQVIPHPPRTMHLIPTTIFNTHIQKITKINGIIIKG